MKIDKISEWEKKDAIVDKDNNVLCPKCKKRLAKITEFGMIRNCKQCGEEKESYGMAIINEFGKNKYY